MPKGLANANYRLEIVRLHQIADRLQQELAPLAHRRDAYREAATNLQRYVEAMEDMGEVDF